MRYAYWQKSIYSLAILNYIFNILDYINQFLILSQIQICLEHSSNNALIGLVGSVNWKGVVKVALVSWEGMVKGIFVIYPTFLDHV